MDDGSEGDRHRYFEELAVAHVLGGLDESEGGVFRSHLLECADCRAQVGELRAIAHDLADAERDERRVRAAQAIETKRRESEDEDDDDSIEIVRGSRLWRVLFVVGLALVLALGVWNVTLRGVNRQMALQNDRLVRATSVLQFGEDARIDYLAPSATASVKLRDGTVAVLLDDLSPGAQYGVYLRTQDGDVAWAEPYEATADGRLLLTATLPRDASTIEVTRRAETARTLPAEPAGSFILRATIPSD